MEIKNNVDRYMELMNKSELSASEQKERARLRRLLTARGLDPKRIRGLVDRALIFDNQGLINKFIETAERNEHSDKISDSAQRDYDDLLQRLHILGIENTNYRRLQNVLDDLKRNAKAADRLKRTKTTRAPHKSPAIDEEIYDDADDEYDEEDDVYAVPAEAAAF